VATLLNVGTGTVHEIPPADVAIGRDPECAIVLDGRDVSRRHARIVYADGHYAIVDESTNGVFINGERAVASQTLEDGDVIRVADVIFRFGTGELAPSDSLVPDAPLHDDALRNDDASPTTTPIPRRRPSERRPAVLLATLDVVEGSVPRGMRFQIERPVVQIGRGAASDVCLLDATISGSHATLMLRGGTWYLLDHASFNGTYVDGVRVNQCALPGACDLRLGGVTLRFRPVANQEQPSTSSTDGRTPAR
jgi:pSer/pThr/pTyr-binding forkhead associated (FHA) protein